MNASHHHQFAADYLALNQISEKRQRRVMKLLGEIESWLGRDLHTIEPSELTRWMAEKVSAGKDVNTVRFWLNMLRPYLRWSWKSAGLISAEKWLLLDEIGPPRGATGITTPRPYKRPEIAGFWKALDETFPLLDRPTYFIERFQRGTSPYRRLRQHLRNVQTRAIVTLALTEGLRRNEIYCMDTAMLHPENAYLLVCGKRVDHRDKNRDVPYIETARGIVDDWLSARKLLKPRHRSTWLALIGPNPQRPMSENAFGELLAKVGDGYELHRFRHTFATEQLRAGMPIERLKEILGHANLDQTLAYAKLLREDLQGAMERSNDDFMRAIGMPK